MTSPFEPDDPRQYAHKARHTAYTVRNAAPLAEPKHWYTKRTAKDAPAKLHDTYTAWADGWNAAVAAHVEELNAAYLEECG